ncbi:MAG: ferritin-like domain-containing protein [Burkholderiaceae bacterium]|nr:ferritin-like domain-containing protein [Burkholderiaceae bacterium]
MNRDWADRAAEAAGDDPPPADAPRAERELRHAARAALCLGDPTAKCRAVAALAQSADAIDADALLDDDPAIPGRPALPELVAPKDVPQRSLATREGHQRLIHALAHIEFNAINLALDAIWRFAGMPAAYYRDWLRVAVEEAQHFGLLQRHLDALGAHYGAFRAHDGLWQMAERTRDDVLARMALVPRTLEARGLDASPQVRARLVGIGDHEAASIVDVILRDEIGHVAIGNRWFHQLCRARDIDPIATYDELTVRHQAPRLHGPFNLAARRAAGFLPAELARLPGASERPAG